jgi:hypothetical protein
MRNPSFSRRLAPSLIAAACALTCLGTQAATINVTSRDPAGTGFNDPTPVAPVGGNPGTTLGQQRMNVYKYVAGIWEKALDSSVTINVSAGWEALTCTSTTATLGSAAAYNLWHDFPNGKPGTWYPQALANKLAGTNLSAGNVDTTGYANADIKTQFNANLGNAGCLDGTTFYLGLDGKAGGQINFVETLLHELGHGLGFSVLSVQTSTGYRINSTGTAYVATGGLPSVWEQFMYDNTAGKTWLNMTSAERKASALNNLKLAWNGPNAVAGASFLSYIPVVQAQSPAPGGSRNVDYSTATFGPLPPVTGTLGVLANVATQPNETGPGCDTFNAANSAAVKGKVALIVRGTCAFALKAKNAQNAGAIGVVLYNNAAGIQPPGGTDATVTIPVVGVSQADGLALQSAITAAVPYGTRSKAGAVTLNLAQDTTRRAGADAAGRPLLYTPTTLVSGSSVSHWDVTATPNLLMEPNINADLTTTLTPPLDLTLPVMKDIGW